MEKNFIMTSDSETAKELRDCGFVELESKDGVYIFLNCCDLKFNFSNKKKLVFTNKLCI